MKRFIWAAFLTGLISPAWNLARAHGHDHDKTGESGAKPVLNGDSLYNSKSKWRDPSGGEFKLASLRGQKVVLTMAYTGCTYTCPLAVAKLKEIESALVREGGGDFKIVLASFDPLNDTPAKLARYLNEKHLSDRWVLLSPRSDSDVRELAALLGISYSKDKKGEYSHSNIITYADREGIVRHTLIGIGADFKPLVKAVLAAGHHEH